VIHSSRHCRLGMDYVCLRRAKVQLGINDSLYTTALSLLAESGIKSSRVPVCVAAPKGVRTEDGTMLDLETPVDTRLPNTSSFDLPPC
jgi:hypothetical protein